jgi:hypothetical protein
MSKGFLKPDRPLRRETSKFLFIFACIVGYLNIISYPICYPNDGYRLGWIIGSIGATLCGWVAARSEFIAKWCYEERKEDVLQEI